MCVFGDSYVRNHHCPVEETWHAKVAQQLGLRYMNFGINGNCVGYDRESEGYGKAMIDRVGELPDSASIILIIAGHNDAAMITEHKNYSVELFSRRLDILLKHIIKKFPSASIGYVTPWNVNRRYFAEVTSEIKRICKSNKIPVLDASTSSIEVNDPDFREKYFQGDNDTAHLNDHGHNLLVDWAMSFIQGIINR